ncbi:glycosyltransferase family A protein [Rufibacter hautae]|uniref:glycosyltransferase family A protein n=1 Tax=Rufibacter hautae TaxID=2595005 RepID=UPI001680181C|nr:glycosyltransferase family 2 protein [Rufibacter hautae]
MNSQLVSIIIPNFNRAKIISETLDSIYNQTYSNWEAIIVDDESNDLSQNVVESFVEKDKRFFFIKRSRSPKGAPTCRNIGIEHAKGKYIIFLDSDDLLAPYCLEQRVDYMQKNQNLDFAVFPMLVFTNKPGDSNVIWNSLDERNDLQRFLHLDLPWQTTSPIWKSESLIKVGLWDELAMNWQDWDFHIRALVANCVYAKVKVLPDCFLRRNVDVSRISEHNITLQRFKSRIRLFEKILALITSVSTLQLTYKNVFAGHFIKIMEQIIVNRVPIRITTVLDIVNKYKLVNKYYEYIVWLYLLVFRFFSNNRFTIIRSGLYKAIRYILPPSILETGSTHFKVKLKDEEMAEVKKYLFK